MYKKIKSIKQKKYINFLNNNNYSLKNRINRKIIKENALYDFYVINLLDRKDRYEHIINVFKNYDINLYFIDGFNETIGHLGCSKSHLYAVNYAKNNKMPYIIVVEDDFIFNESLLVDEFYNVLDIITSNSYKYEIFNGSPTFWDQRNSMHNIKKYKSFNDDFYLITNGQKTTFIVYTQNMYDKLINEFNPNTELHIDQYFAQNFKQLCYKKYICYELNSYSNITKTNVDNNDYLKKEEDFYINLSIMNNDITNNIINITSDITNNIINNDINNSKIIIGIYGIFINKYIQHYESFIQNINKYFFPRNKKIFFIVSDSDLPIIDDSEIIFIKKPYIGWPYETLYRFKYFLSFNKNDILKTNVIYFFNSNARCNNIINNILPDDTGYIFTLHNSFTHNIYANVPYEKNKLSTAYVPFKLTLKYIGGGFFGAETNKFLKMCEILNNNITIDEQKNYIAIWHDESHLNWYSNVFLNNIYKCIDISYHIPEEIKEQFKNINIYYLFKNNILFNKPIDPKYGKRMVYDLV